MKSNEDSHVGKYAEEDENYWQKHLSALTASGLTRMNYCKEYHVNYHRFGYWKRLLLANQSKTQAKQTTIKPLPLVPISVRVEEQGNEVKIGLCSLHFKNGIVLRIYEERVLSLILERVQ